MRLETTRGKCVDKYTASLPLTSSLQYTSDKIRKDNAGSENTTAYSCENRERRQKIAKNASATLPHVGFFDYSSQ